MANLTITVDDEVLRRARVRAVGQGTSVNAILREHLDRYADTNASDRAAAAFLAVAQAVQAAPPGSQAHDWSREELYLERFDRS